MTAEFDNIADGYRLSSAQEGMLYHTLASPAGGTYSAQVTFSLQGKLNTKAFDSAWQEVVNRHDALKTSFLWEGLDNPLQVVQRRIHLPVRFEDWIARDAEQIDRLWQEWLLDDRRSAFNLAEAPLMRLGIVRTAQDEYRCVWTCHHMLADGWSTPLVLADVMAIYGANCAGGPVNLPEAPRYRDFIAWQYGQDRGAAEGFWRAYLSGARAALLPRTLRGLRRAACADGKIPVKSIQFRSRESDSLREFARRHRLTLTTVMQGAWALLLSRYLATDDVLFGTTVSGRSPELLGSESGVGLYLNTLPTRVRVDDERELVAWLSELQSSEVRKRDFQATALADVQRWCSSGQSQPLFESLVVTESHSSDIAFSDPANRLTLSNVEYHTRSNYPLCLLVLLGSRIELAIVYDLSRISHASASRLMDQLCSLLNSFVAAPAVRLGAIHWDAIDQAPSGCGAGSFEYPRSRCLHELFEGLADEDASRTAVVHGTQEYSYGWLERESNRLAHTLRGHNIEAGDRVGMLPDRSPRTLVSILGILKAGAAYVPLDPSLPAPRLARIAADAALKLAAGTRKQRHQAAGLPVRVIDEDACAAASDARPRPVNSSEQHAYVIYTSGSTGNPKGVCVSHRNAVHSTFARFDYYQTSSPRFLLLSSYAFDSSVAGIFWTLCGGGTLILPEQGEYQDIASLRKLIGEHHVTHLLSLPSVYQLIAERGPGEDLQSLRAAIVAGEACPRSCVEAHRRAANHAALFNEYGPTEATVWATVYRVPNHGSLDVVPIGQPVGTTQVYLLDHARRPVPTGAPGEIYLGGEGIAAGYLNEPELTAQRFVAHPSRAGERLYRTGDLGCWSDEGQLLFLGRCDQQIKIRGHRIELEEIEAVLAGHPAVSETAVSVRDLRGETRAASRVPEVAELVAALDRLEEGTADALLRRLERKQPGVSGDVVAGSRR